MSPMSSNCADLERVWFQTGQSVLADGDDRLAEDDFDGACRRFLIAAYCFARAGCSTDRPGDRHEYRSAFRYALYAAEPLLASPGGCDQSHSSRTRSGSP